MSSATRSIEVPGDFSVEAEAGGAVLYMYGEIDAAAVERFAEDMARDRAHDGRVRAVDAAAVTFFGVSGASLLLRMTVETRRVGMRPIMRSAVGPVVRVLELTRTAQSFDIQP